MKMSVLAMVALLAASASAQQSLEPGGQQGVVPGVELAPKLEFVGYEHDFGAIFDDEQQSHTFHFTNTGNAALTINETKTTCGCTTPALTKKTYLPGESGQIVINFNPNRKKGTTHQRVTVKSNDPVRPQIMLSIFAEVKRRVILEPPILAFNQAHRGETATKTMTVAGRGESFELREVVFASPEMFGYTILDESEMVEIDGEQRRRFTIEVTLKEDAPVGRHNTIMEIVTSEEQAKIETHVSANIMGELVATPTRIQLRNLQKGSPYTAQLRISHRGRDNFKIQDVSVKAINGTEPEVLIKEINGSAYRIVLNGVTPDDQQLVRGEIVVTTDIPGEMTKRVQYYGNIVRTAR